MWNKLKLGNHFCGSSSSKNNIDEFTSWFTSGALPTVELTRSVVSSWNQGTL